MHDVVAEIARVKGQFMAEWGPRLTSNEVPISPYRVFTELMQTVDIANTIVTHDSGYPRDQLVPFWPVTTPRGYLGWGKSTQLGYGLGLAVPSCAQTSRSSTLWAMRQSAWPAWTSRRRRGRVCRS